MTHSLIGQPYKGATVGVWLKDQCARPEFRHLRIIVAFVQASGVALVEPWFREFAGRGGSIEILCGVDMGGTSFDGLSDLQALISSVNGKAWVCKNPKLGAFHPKGYCFNGDERYALYVGSGNLSASGLFRNYELGIVSEGTADTKIREDFDGFFDHIIGEARTTLALSPSLIDELLKRRYVVSEIEARANTASSDSSDRLFSPLFTGWSPPRSAISPRSRPAPVEHLKAVRHFVMTLQNTDVGVGQTTPGTARRSPEIFIPLGALRADLDFWKWDAFVDDATWNKKIDANGYGKRDRFNVPIYFSGEVIRVNLMYNPDKGDLRIRGEALRSAGGIGDILEMERVDAPGYEYVARVVPPASSDFERLLGLCVNAVPSARSAKRWGYF